MPSRSVAKARSPHSPFGPIHSGDAGGPPRTWEMPTPEENHRQHERVRLGGRAFLLVDPRSGLVTARGQLVDLSEGGCQLRLQRRVDPHRVGRVRLVLAGKALWLPVVTRWVRS